MHNTDKPNKVRVGIIGCGGIARDKHIPALLKLENVELVGFHDVVVENAAKVAKNFGSDAAKVYPDYEKLLEDKSVDVVHVCTPNKTHAKICIDALEAGKHVMCEKPMATSTEDARKMLDASRRTGKKLSVSYQQRFRADSQYLHQLCQDGQLGEIYFAKAHAVRRRAVPTWGVFLDKDKQGGGALIDIGTHALDLTLWMMNNYKPKYVVGNIYNKLGKIGSEANAWGSWNPKDFSVEDSAFGFITMENGATIILESSWALNTMQNMEAKTTLCGTQGGADMMDGLRINGERFGKLYSCKPSLEGKDLEFYNGEKEDPGEVEAKRWIECIINDTPPVVKPEEAMIVTEILEAIYKSAETGKPEYFNKSLG